MSDLFHQWGSDLALGPTGDLATVSGSMHGQQRILRRLLTSPSDYIWQMDYGAGLGVFVGSPASPLHIRAVIRSQVFKEAAVARTPEPVIDVEMTPGAGNGGAYVHLRYSDSETNQTQPLTLTVNGP